MGGDSLSEVSKPLMSDPIKASGAQDDPPRTEKPAKTVLEFKELGVWTVMTEINAGGSWTLPGRAVIQQGREMMAIFPIVYHFLHECFSVSPWTMVVYILASLWNSTEDAVNLYFSSQLLNIIQKTITNQTVDGSALAKAVIYRVVFTLMNSVISKTKKRAGHVLANRIRYLFEERLIQANLRLDLPTFQAPETASKINKYFGRGSRGGAWEIFEDLISKITTLSSVVSQLSFIFGALRSQPGGYWFAVVCLGKSAFVSVSDDSIWGTTSFIWDSNPHYRRMRSLVDIVTDATHRVEIISDGLKDHIQREWAKARVLLGDTSDDYPDSLVELQRSSFLSFIDAFTEDFPLIFYAFQVYLSPQSFSLTSIALIQQASSSLTWTFYRILREEKSFRQRLEEMKTVSELGKIQNTIKDGELHYPKDVLKHSPGMEIRFQNVSFAYPKSESVIKDVSFTIGKGQAVVIVGINGSGKSTLLKLFNRLYDPSSGGISIDGTPLSSFVASDVRRSMAMLSQSYTHYPLSIRENISLGLPDASYESAPGEAEKGQHSMDDLVKEAARLGGATEVIGKQRNGFDAVLQPKVYSWSTSSATRGTQAFQDKMKDVTKDAEVSLGQWQRLALSRLFYRAAAKHIKLVAVDEPSASLDPKMEYELFESLRAVSTEQGKTMIFVTHRFGYLTKRADLILVMQNGCLVEQGKHSELLDLGGEYAKLYKLQAEAFLPDNKNETPIS
ncbi:P-loop containing nucleoside triphosphate hydrolase protein [Gautieria morchelliformis]|nr:P-loop containing nucleoside triphosphate hydrolase protein [Gautieria morchelliformis]